MQVVAISPGFYKGKRVRTGDIFELNEKYTRKGKLPSWVKAAPDAAQAKTEAAAAKKAKSEKVKEGIIASSGGKASKDKADALAKEAAGEAPGNELAG